jgi:copper homeostasis protein
MTTILFELCAESIEAARAGASGGAHRVELCSELALSGVTPVPELMAADLRSLAIPVHVLIRPRAGNFFFSPGEFALMQRQIEQAKHAGASGVAVGVLCANGCVDVERTRILVQLAHPMAVTFHRAFDETPDVSEALERVIETGADGLLTSGGAANVLSGADSIARLQRQAAGRIHIIAGGGLRLASLPEVVRRSGTYSLHGSLINGNGQSPKKPNVAALEADVREALRLLRYESDRLQARAVGTRAPSSA